VVLDCYHAFEVKALDIWMESQKTNAVKYNECPKCKAPVMKCKRYMTQINQTLNDINAIKLKILEKEKLYEAQLLNIEVDISNLKVNISKFDTSSESSPFGRCLKIV
jgi:hypothetical protein